MSTPQPSEGNDKDTIVDGFRVHSKDICTAPCPFHYPSDHPLKDAPMHIRADKMFLVERICEHGIGHDDPDSVTYMQAHGQTWAGVHGCDGCCTGEKIPTTDPLPSQDSQPYSTHVDNGQQQGSGSNGDIDSELDEILDKILRDVRQITLAGRNSLRLAIRAKAALTSLETLVMEAIPATKMDRLGEWKKQFPETKTPEYGLAQGYDTAITEVRAALHTLFKGSK